LQTHSSKWRNIMNSSTTTKFTGKKFTSLIALSLALSMTACSSMSTRDKSTAIGAGVGAVAGAVLTGGSALGTVGGAAVGGVIGNQIGK
jgi:osmotically inducible lipoprotein OsmB